MVNSILTWVINENETFPIFMVTYQQFQVGKVLVFSVICEKKVFSVFLVFSFYRQKAVLSLFFQGKKEQFGPH